MVSSHLPSIRGRSANEELPAVHAWGHTLQGESRRTKQELLSFLPSMWVLHMSSSRWTTSCFCPGTNSTLARRCMCATSTSVGGRPTSISTRRQPGWRAKRKARRPSPTCRRHSSSSPPQWQATELQGWHRHERHRGASARRHTMRRQITTGPSSGARGYVAIATP